MSRKPGLSRGDSFDMRRQMTPSVHFERTFSERPWIVFVASKVAVSTPLQPQLLTDDIHQVRYQPHRRCCMYVCWGNAAEYTCDSHYLSQLASSPRCCGKCPFDPEHLGFRGLNLRPYPGADGTQAAWWSVAHLYKRANNEGPRNTTDDLLMVLPFMWRLAAAAEEARAAAAPSTDDTAAAEVFVSSHAQLVRYSQVSCTPPQQQPLALTAH